MNAITEYLVSDHQHCDELFALAEAAASGKEMDRAPVQAFLDAMRQHFKREEEVLFPSVEARTGMHMGPTRVMRMEHRQMEELFQDLEGALQWGDRENFLGLAETLLVMMQQHNMKEEQILYPMADQVLNGKQADMISAMRQLDT